MKLAEYVAEFLASQGLRHVFGITGGASLHLIHAIAGRPDMRIIFTHHEQAAAMAADAYSRVTGKLGAAVATSGPGATNLITGICCAYYDSVPAIYITGQVATFRSKGDMGIRQLGFQETDIVDMCGPITKYAVKISDPQTIRKELEKAVYLARCDRPGPVLVDIPDDLQRKQIDPESLDPFCPPTPSAGTLDWTNNFERCIDAIQRAQRPVVIVGWGVRLAHAEKELLEALRLLNFPVLPTWAMVDMFPHDYPQLAGTFGTHGSRCGNFAVQNADLVLAIGSRLDTHETGSPPTSFARQACKIVVDIDPAELRKFKSHGVNIDFPFCIDAAEFLRELCARLDGVELSDTHPWQNRIAAWQDKYPAIQPQYREEHAVNPYVFMEALSRFAQPGDIIVSDTGCALAWAMQGFSFRESQRFLHAFNNTPMGYALPASIGAALAEPARRVICITGDGALQMNIQELATLAHYKLNIRIFVINNDGYSMIRQTQDQWLDSSYIGSSPEGGVSMPDFQHVAKAYGIKATQLKHNEDVLRMVNEVLCENGPILCDVNIPSSHRVVPQVKFGYPIEDSEPLLPRDEFMENMIVQPLPASLHGSR
jgi:acetolactate synthase-1/2/3 large subunit